VRDSDLNELTGLVYEAAWAPDSTSHLLERLKNAFKGCNATLGIASPGLDVVSRYHSLTPPEVAVEYANVVIDDPWAQALVEPKWSGAFLGTDLVDQRVYRKSEMYQRFNKPCDIEYLAIAADTKSSHINCWLTVNRSRRQGNFSSDDRRALHHLYRHVTRASSLQWSSAQPAEWRVRCRQSGVCELDGDFDDLQFQLPSLRVAANGIRSTDPVLDRQLQQSLTRALSTGSATVLRMLLEDGQRCLVVRVIPPTTAAQYIQTAAAVESVDTLQSQVDIIASAYQLTRSESQVVASLCAGQSVADIATERRTSVGAVRFNLKNVFQKLNVKRQSELVRMVLAGPA